MDHFCYFVSCLSGFLVFIAAMWPPTRKGLTSLLSCVGCFVVFCHVPLWCPEPGVVLYCIDS